MTTPVSRRSSSPSHASDVNTSRSAAPSMADSEGPTLLRSLMVASAAELEAREGRAANRPKGAPPPVKLEIPWGEERPATRAGCLNRPRPCPWVSCRHNLSGVEVTRVGSIRILGTKAEALRDRPAQRRPTQQREDEFIALAVERVATRWRSCVLDLVESEETLTLQEIGDLFDISPEGARQVEIKALRNLRDLVPAKRLARMVCPE